MGVTVTCVGGQVSIHYHAAVDEPRFVTLGLSNLAHLLVVVYTYKEPDAIRLISAWKANKRQRKAYEKGRR